MKLQSIVTTLLVIGASAAFAQQQTPTDEPGLAVEAQLQLPTDQAPALSEEEKDIVRRLEQIENDPVVRAKAAAEAKVPLSAF